MVGHAWAPAPRRAQTAGTAPHHAPADLHPPPRRVTDRDDLGVAQGRGGAEPGTGVAPALSPPPATLDDAPDLEQRRALGLPAIGEQEGALSHTRHDWGHPRGRVRLGARASLKPA